MHMQNSVTVLTQSKDEEREGKWWKVLSLALVGTGANLLATSALERYLASATSELLFIIAGGGLIGLTVFVLQALFVKRAWLLRLIVFVESIAPIVLFTDRLFPSLSVVLLAAAGAFFFFANMGSMRGLRYAATSMSIHFFEAARMVIPKAMTGALLFMTALIYLTYFSWGTLNDAVGKRFVNQMLTSADPALQLYFPRVSVDQTVGTFLAGVVRSQLEGEKNTIINSLSLSDDKSLQAFRNLSVQERDAIVARVTDSFRKSLEPVAGPLDPSMLVRDEVYRMLELKFGSLSPSQYTTFTIGGLVLVFLALKGFLSLFHWLVAVFVFLVFKLLMALGFGRVGVATQTREFVILS